MKSKTFIKSRKLLAWPPAGPVMAAVNITPDSASEFLPPPSDLTGQADID
jgi:hypothetical protein